MAQDGHSALESPRKRTGLLRDQVQLVKRKDCDRYEIAPIEDTLSFEKGFFAVYRACQLLAQKNEGIILVGVAGPSGAGKTVFTEKIVTFMQNVGIINMDNYNDGTRVVDGNFDDPRLTDYDTLLENIHGLKAGNPVQIPIYDYKSSSRIGYRTMDVPTSRIIFIEGIYALSQKLRPLLDLRVSVTGGVHFDLVKRVLRDIQRAGQEPEEIIHQISETVYPMYKAFIEPDLKTAHIKIINKFNPFSGFQNPTYVLKSAKTVTADQIKAVLSEDCTETTEETYDIYLLPPGEDPEACQSYLRMRNRDGKYSLMFEEWVNDSPFIISPRITFEVSVRLLGGLMALGYTIASILKRDSHVFSNDRVCVKTDWLEQLNRKYVQGVVSQLSEQISTLNERMDEFTSRIEELNSKISTRNNASLSASQQNLVMQSEASNAVLAQPSLLGLGNGSVNGSLLHGSSSASQLARESPFMEELVLIARGQRQILHQIDNLNTYLRENYSERHRQGLTNQTGAVTNIGSSYGVPLLLSFAIGGLGIVLFKAVSSQK